MQKFQTSLSVDIRPATPVGQRPSSALTSARSSGTDVTNDVHKSGENVKCALFRFHCHTEPVNYKIVLPPNAKDQV